MNKFTRFIAYSAAAFFTVGIGWGLWSQRARQIQMNQATPLRVLCAENWISEKALQAFSIEHNIPVQLWTYARPSEFLRQMANSDSKVDVLCTSSMLIKSLIQSHWIKKSELGDLPNLQQVSVDFRQLPYDPGNEYSVPVLWNLYGFFALRQNATAEKWKKTWTTKQISLWGEEVGLLNAMKRFGVKIEEQLEQEENKGLDERVLEFSARAAKILRPQNTPLTAEAALGSSDILEVPLSHVAQLLEGDSPYTFWLPEDGGSMDVGILAIGARSEQPQLAKALINSLLSTENALQMHKRLGTGVVHASLNNENSIAQMQKAQTLRKFPLTRLNFPEVNVEALPRFQKIYDQTLNRQ